MKRNFITSKLISSKKVIVGTKSRILELEENIKRIQGIDNYVKAIVELFKVISPILDQGGFIEEISKLERRSKGKYAKQIEALHSLHYQLYNSGRDIYGMNRTKNGEEVTADKVFLGNCYGIWTITAAFLLENEKKLKSDAFILPDYKDDSGNPASVWYQINNLQCKSLVKHETMMIIRNIEIIKKVF